MPCEAEPIPPRQTADVGQGRHGSLGRWRQVLPPIKATEQDREKRPGNKGRGIKAGGSGPADQGRRISRAKLPSVTAQAVVRPSVASSRMVPAKVPRMMPPLTLVMLTWKSCSRPRLER